MTSQGIYFVAVGEKAEREAQQAQEALLRFDQFPVAVTTENLMEGLTGKQISRQLKIELFKRTPWEQVCYMDADTRAYTSIRVGFDILSDGWDLVITPSANQGEEAFWHVGDLERERTLDSLGESVLQLQAGVFWIRRNKRTEKFMRSWSDEWNQYRDEDQAAFARALRRLPLKIWLLSRDWNGGVCIGHRWGMLR